MVVSKESLESEPCREELNYALRRALESRGSTFPLIGIFVEEVDTQLIPAAIATRLYVNIEASDWIERVRSGVEGLAPISRFEAIGPVAIKLYRNQGRYELIVEARPRTGLWNPCVAKVLLSEKDHMYGAMVRPAGKLPRVGATHFVEGRAPGEPEWFLRGPADDATASPTMSMFTVFHRAPTRLFVGSPAELFEVDLSARPVIAHEIV